MLLEAEGGNAQFKMEPFKRIVEVYGDSIDYIAQLRVAALLEIQAFLQGNPVLNTSDMQAELMRSLKFSLRDTKLEEYPETIAEQQAVIERMKCSKL